MIELTAFAVAQDGPTIQKDSKAGQVGKWGPQVFEATAFQIHQPQHLDDILQGTDITESLGPTRHILHRAMCPTQVNRPNQTIP